MKKTFALLLVLALAAAFAGCSGTQNVLPVMSDNPVVTEAPTEAPAATEAAPEVTPAAETPAPVADDSIPQEWQTGDAAPYAQVLLQYRTAVTEKWGGERLAAEDMSFLCMNIYAEGSTAVLGYRLEDINNDGIAELIIGDAAAAEPAAAEVLDLYTLEDGAVVHVFSGSERNCFYLTKDEAAENICFILNEGSSGAAQSSWVHFTLSGSQLTVTQSIQYDALVNADAPWYMGMDDDGDVSNDTPTDEKTARSIIESMEYGRFVPEYTPFTAE